MGKLDTAYGPLVEMFNAHRIYVIPDFQRDYSWKPQKQVAELWGDVVRLYQGRIAVPPREDSHFIGSIVIGSAATKALGASEAPVIDGQQRLLTLSLLLIAIRDELVPDIESKNAITQQYLALVRNGEITDTLVRPGDKDRDVYVNLVKGKPIADKKSPVYRSYKWFCDALNQELSTGKEELDELSALTTRDEEIETSDETDSEVEAVESSPWDWSKLIEVIGGSLELVSISDVPPENSYAIFATLNSTGTPLDQIDLIRNAIFMLLPKTHEKIHRELWKPMEKTMGKDLFQSYFHTWVMTRGRNVPAKDTYKSVLQELKKDGATEAKVSKSVSELFYDAWSYLLITRPTTKDRDGFRADEKVKVTGRILEPLKRLQDWGTTPMEPILLVLIQSWRDEDTKFSSDELVRSLALLESFVVRRFICQVPPNDLRSIFARITQQLQANNDQGLLPKLENALFEPNRRWPDDKAMLEAFASNQLYRSPGQKQTFFILKRIAEKLEGKECPHITLGTAKANFSIEHILPQTLSDEWKRDLKAWGEPDPTELWEQLRHTAGNLTLTAYNSELGNSSFKKKKDWIDKQSRLELSRQILQDVSWSSTEILARSNSLAQEALKIWER